mmetsp:Transcript_120953/g.353385  ORF Transcript_120953/g.353385 Transcript_120953/m.353385 type:complete len:221 (+) Transcript_120953:535-1197(+)
MVRVPGHEQLGKAHAAQEVAEGVWRPHHDPGDEAEGGAQDPEVRDEQGGPQEVPARPLRQRHQLGVHKAPADQVEGQIAYVPGAAIPGPVPAVRSGAVPREDGKDVDVGGAPVDGIRCRREERDAEEVRGVEPGGLPAEVGQDGAHVVGARALQLLVRRSEALDGEEEGVPGRSPLRKDVRGEVANSQIVNLIHEDVDRSKELDQPQRVHLLHGSHSPGT